MELPATSERVLEHTSERVNRRIDERTEERLRYYARHPDEIEKRLGELKREWDIERTLETNASVLALAGLGLGAFVDRRWYVLPGIVTAFLLQHALQGWCPPVPVFRRLGVRTAREIETERHALKYLRGDYEDSRGDSSAASGRAGRALRRVSA